MNRIYDKIINIINLIKKLNQSYKQTLTNIDYSGQNKATHNHADIKNTCIRHADIKDRICKLIKENENYFIGQIINTTIDTILHDNIINIERLKTLGYPHRVAAEIFEKYRILIYVCDLYTYIYAPKDVKRQLGELIEEYGIEIITEEIAIYLKENYSEKFEIKMVCTP